MRSFGECDDAGPATPLAAAARRLAASRRIAISHNSTRKRERRSASFVKGQEKHDPTQHAQRREEAKAKRSDGRRVFQRADAPPSCFQARVATRASSPLPALVVQKTFLARNSRSFLPIHTFVDAFSWASTD